jgi:hypothetical protein
MIVVKFDEKGLFYRQMNNLVKYSEGFLEGARKGKTPFLRSVGENTKEILESFIDVNARTNPEALHHVYEWYQTGSPDARLYDITYTISNLGLSFKSNFSQSSSVSNSSSEPFRDKARMMEAGVSIRVSPRNANYLKFEVDGETVYTPNPVFIPEAGGSATTGSFERVFDMFFERYFSQSFLQASRVRQKINNPVSYKKNLPSGLKNGRSAGIPAGYRWIANIGVESI